MHKVFKLIYIFIYLIKSSFRALLYNDLDSKNKLTQIFIWLSSEKGPIPKFALVNNTDSPLKLHAFILQNQLNGYDNRICLLSYEELIHLISLVNIFKPTHIFEFGTYKGGSLKHFILNTNEDVIVHSLDLTHVHLSDQFRTFFSHKNNVHLHLTNSQYFNFEPFYKTQDFIFIDGGHDYETVKSDSENAFRIIKADGVIVWDDYSNEQPGVYKYLNELFKTKPFLFQIKNTSLVVLDYNNRLSKY